MRAVPLASLMQKMGPSYRFDTLQNMKVLLQVLEIRWS